MKILGLDHGTKYIGVAISDSGLTVASPLEFIKVTSDEENIRRIKVLVEENDVSKIILGLPKNLNGEEGEQAIKVRKFGKELEILGVEIEYVDERFSTQVGIEGITGKKKRGEKDIKAAQIILQTYLDSLE